MPIPSNVPAIPRPTGVIALSVFFLFGAIVSFVSVVSLLTAGGPLEPMWRINPRAREGFASMGPWAIVLLSVVCVACAFSARGLSIGARWGYRLAIGVLAVNLIGDAGNALLGTEPRAAVGVPIAGAVIAYLLSARARRFFGMPPLRKAAERGA